MEKVLRAAVNVSPRIFAFIRTRSAIRVRGGGSASESLCSAGDLHANGIQVTHKNCAECTPTGTHMHTHTRAHRFTHTYTYTGTRTAMHAELFLGPGFMQALVCRALSFLALGVSLSLELGSAMTYI